MTFTDGRAADDHPRVHARGGRAQPRAADRRPCCRKAARRVAEGETENGRASTRRRVRESLGPRRFAADVRKRTSEPGVATGLAVTAAGGDVLFIEATAYPGEGRLQVTGQLGEVMQESAQAALSWVRTHTPTSSASTRTGSPRTTSTSTSRPAPCRRTARPPGITMATAIVSLATGKPVSEQVAMTGEITLTGQVLPIGGVRDKVLAAQRAGISKVIFPKENESDLEELPPETREELEFVPVDWIEEVLGVAFDGSLPKVAPARPLSPERKAAASR